MKILIFGGNGLVGSSLNRSLPTKLQDAEIFVSICSDVFDLIVIDIFVDDQIPEPFLEPEFLTQIVRLLDKQGMLMFNHMAMTAEQKNRVDSYIEQVMRPIFPACTYIATRNNRILVNSSQFIR